MAHATSGTGTGLGTAKETWPEPVAIATTGPASIAERPAPESIAGQGMASTAGSAQASTAEVEASAAAAIRADEARDFVDPAKIVVAMGQVALVVLTVVYRTSTTVVSTATLRQAVRGWRRDWDRSAAPRQPVMVP